MFALWLATVELGAGQVWTWVWAGCGCCCCRYFWRSIATPALDRSGQQRARNWPFADGSNRPASYLQATRALHALLNEPASRRPTRGSRQKYSLSWSPRRPSNASSAS